MFREIGACGFPWERDVYLLVMVICVEAFADLVCMGFRQKCSLLVGTLSIQERRRGKYDQKN